MTFLFPGFLWALAALAIPVIIHLTNTVFFNGTLTFFRDVGFYFRPQCLQLISFCLLQRRTTLARHATFALACVEVAHEALLENILANKGGTVFDHL